MSATNLLNFRRPLGVEAPEQAWRTFTLVEADALKVGDGVMIWEVGTRNRFHGTVQSIHRDEEVRIVNRAGHLFAFDFYDDGCGSEDPTQRYAPRCEEDGSVYRLVTTSPLDCPADDEGPSDIFNAMKATLVLAALEKRVALCEEGLSAHGSILENAATTMEVGGLLELVRALRDEVAALRKWINEQRHDEDRPRRPRSEIPRRKLIPLRRPDGGKGA